MDHDGSTQISTPDTTVTRRMTTPDSTVTRHSTGSINRSLLTPCRRIGLGRPSSGSLKKSAQTGSFRSPSLSDENSPGTPRNVETPHLFGNRSSNISPLATRNYEDSLCHSKKELKSTPVTSKISGHTVINRSVSKNNLSKRSGIKRRLSDASESKENKNIQIQLVEVENNNTEASENRGNTPTEIENAVVDKVESAADTEQTCLQETSYNKQKLEIINRTLAEIAQRIKMKKKHLEDVRIQKAYAKKNDLSTLRDLTRKWRKAGQEALRRMLKMAEDMGYKVTLLELIQQYNFPLELIRYNTELEEFEFEGFE